MRLTERPVVWSIAGSDSGGGAGLQADLLTLNGLGVHACTVVTAVTSQNSLGVSAVETVEIGPQLESLASDLPARVIKIGMLANCDQVGQLSEALRHYRQHWTQPPFVVYDPVMAASSGDALSQEDLRACIRNQLLPCIDLLTPNRAEAEQLSGLTINDADSVARAASELRSLGCRAVVITGGHLDTANQARDSYFDEQRQLTLSSPRINSPHHHGSGCVFASAVAACIAQDYPIEDALVLGKAYINRGIAEARPVGAGAGPVAHRGWPEKLEHFPDVMSMHNKAPFKTCETQQLGLYPVVHSMDWIDRLLQCGVKTLQLRIKTGSPKTIEREIAAAIELARAYNARLFINDYWQLAIKHDAYGVHLGQEDLETADLDAIRQAGLRLGISTHGYYEMLRAHACRPSYIALGAIYPTTTKTMPSRPQGLAKLKNYVRLMGTHYPLVAIGGISLQRAEAVWQQQPGSIAVVSAITQAENYQAAVQAFMQITGETYAGH